MLRLRNYVFAAAAALTLIHSAPAFAQDEGQSSQDAKDAQLKKEFGSLVGPLPAMKNAGPCPFVKTLYDAARYIEFKDDKPASENVVYSGEIEKIASNCEYRGDEPIKVQMRILFELGRGPQARSDHKTYRYWVAVTDRNNAVLAKQWFDLPVTFPAGRHRVAVTDTLKGIRIPRADARVSGANFEVLTGFEVTPAMADFNRQGKRFLANAGEAGPAPKKP